MTKQELVDELHKSHTEVRKLKSAIGTLKERVRFSIGEYNELVLYQRGNEIRIETYKGFTIAPVAGNNIRLVFKEKEYPNEC